MPPINKQFHRILNNNAKKTKWRDHRHGRKKSMARLAARLANGTVTNCAGNRNLHILQEKVFSSKLAATSRVEVAARSKPEGKAKLWPTENIEFQKSRTLSRSFISRSIHCLPISFRLSLAISPSLDYFLFLFLLHLCMHTRSYT